VSTNIAFNFLESDPFQVLLIKKQIPGNSREIELALPLSRELQNGFPVETLV
jgi:hypothetical protein